MVSFPIDLERGKISQILIWKLLVLPLCKDQGHNGCSPTSSTERAQNFPSFWCWESHMETLAFAITFHSYDIFQVHSFSAKNLSGPLVLENVWRWENLYVSFRDLSTSFGGKCGKSYYCHQKAVAPDWASDTDLWHVVEDKRKISEEGLALVEAITTWLCL